MAKYITKKKKKKKKNKVYNNIIMLLVYIVYDINNLFSISLFYIIQLKIYI